MVRYSVLLETVSDTLLPPSPFPLELFEDSVPTGERGIIQHRFNDSPSSPPRRVRSSLQAVRKPSQTMDRSLAHELNNTSFSRIQLSSILRFICRILRNLDSTSPKAALCAESFLQVKKLWMKFTTLRIPSEIFYLFYLFLSRSSYGYNYGKFVS